MIFSALKPVILRDSDSFRQKIFSELKSRSTLARYAEKLYLSSPPILRSWLLLAYGLKSFLEAPELTGNISCVYSYQNEKTRFEYINAMFGNRVLDFCKISAGWNLPEKVLSLLLNISDLPRLIRLLKFISGRFDFLVSCRISSTIFYYSWFKAEVARRKPEAVLLSSEANPYAMGLLWTAKQFFIPTIYVPHGQVSPRPPRLFYDLSLLDGEELKATFAENGPATGQIIFKGTDGEFTPLKTVYLKSPKTIGVFLSIIFDPAKLENAIRQIQFRFVDSSILIRLHPNESVSTDEVLHRLKDLKIILSARRRSLKEDINSCDIIFCGNSGTHLECLRQGVPTIQIPGLDLLPHDTRRFIQNKVVSWYADPALIDVPELTAFYGGDWAKRMKKYDHYYGHSRQEINSILQNDIEMFFKARSGLQDSDRKKPDIRI